MAYQFYFDGAELPVTPGSVEFTKEGSNKTFTLIDEGEINVLKLPKLKEITFDALLPTQEYPFANNSDTDPSTWLETLEGYMDNKTPCQFVIVRTTDTGEVFFGESIRCSVESLTQKEDADEYGFDVQVSITLKQYKDYGTKTVVIKSEAAAETTEAREQDNAPQTPATVDTDKADNPVVMAKTYNNTSETASDIADKNNYSATKDQHTDNSAYWSRADDKAKASAHKYQTNREQMISGGGGSKKVTVSKTSTQKFKEDVEKRNKQKGVTSKPTRSSSSDLLERAQKKASEKTNYTPKSKSTNSAFTFN